MALGIALINLYGCKAPDYVADIGFIVPASANAPEYPVMVKGNLCRDNEGQPGVCAVRVKSNEDFTIDINPQQYDYEVTFNCSSNVPMPFPQSYLVQKDLAFSLTVPFASFPPEKVFTCSVIVYPKDRPEPIAAFARVHVTVIDYRYNKLENPYLKNDYLVLGEHALYSYYADSEGWHMVKEKTVVKNRKGVSEAFVESYTGRQGYYKGSSTVQTQGQL